MAVPADPRVELYELVLKTPSLLGRLVYIASLWNPQTSRYDRYLPQRFRSVDADKALANWHLVFFTEWLSLSLEEKQKDVAIYWKSLGGSRDQIRAIRERGEAAIPPLVRAEERNHFIRDLMLIQAML
jgi:hypothetical protein